MKTSVVSVMKGNRTILTGFWTQHRMKAQLLHNSLHTKTKFSIPVPEQLQIWCPRTDLKSNAGKGRKNRDKFLK